LLRDILDHPNDLTPDILLRSLLQQLHTPQIYLPAINLNGLSKISQYISTLLSKKKSEIPFCYQFPKQLSNLAMIAKSLRSIALPGTF
jgi:predicted glycosyltransferase